MSSDAPRTLQAWISPPASTFSSSTSTCVSPTSGGRRPTSPSGTSRSSRPSCEPPTGRATATPSPRTRPVRSATTTGTRSRVGGSPSAPRNDNATLPAPHARRRGYPHGVARKRSPARLVIALSIAAVLAVFLLYTSIAGGGTPSVKPSELAVEDGPRFPRRRRSSASRRATPTRRACGFASAT